MASPWVARNINPIVQSQDYFTYSSSVPANVKAKFKGNAFKNPGAWNAPKRPKLGANPLKPYGRDTALRYGSLNNTRPQFRPQFASETGFNNFKRANPKTNLNWKVEDIDGDGINDYLVMNPQGQYVAVNGMTEKAANWKQLQPYYTTRAVRQQEFDQAEGFRDEAGNSKVSGIAKAWRNVYLKDVYDTVLNTEKGTEREIEAVKEIRKNVPLSKVAKEFINALMVQEANRAIDDGGIDTAQYSSRDDAIKALKSTKKFKAYIYNLALGAPKTDEYWAYIANIIRNLVLNKSNGVYDISQTQGWQQKGVPVSDEVPNAAVRPAGQVAPPQELNPLEDFARRLANEGQSDIDPDVHAEAAQLGFVSIPHNFTNGDILRMVNQQLRAT